MALPGYPAERIVKGKRLKSSSSLNVNGLLCIEDYIHLSPCMFTESHTHTWEALNTDGGMER